MKGNLLVRGFVGCGKSSTLFGMAESFRAENGSGKAVFVSANMAAGRLLRGDMVSLGGVSLFPYGVAYNYLANSKKRGWSPGAVKAMCGRNRVGSGQVASVLGVKPLDLGRFVATPEWQVLMARQALLCWARSADSEFTRRHLVQPDSIQLSRSQIDVLWPALERIGRAIWRASTDPLVEDGGLKLRLEHDFMLKLWARWCGDLPLGGGVDFLLVDDAHALPAVVLEALSRIECRRAVALDPCRQVFDVDPLVVLGGTWDSQSWLTVSRTVSAQVADKAAAVLDAIGDGHRMSASPNCEYVDVVGDEASVFRSAGGALGQIVASISAGRRVYVPGGVIELKALISGVEALMSGTPPLSIGLAPFRDRSVFTKWLEECGDSSYKKVSDLVDEHGAQAIIDVLNRVNREPTRDAETIVLADRIGFSRWRRVSLGDDFIAPTVEFADGFWGVTSKRSECVDLYRAIAASVDSVTMDAGLESDMAAYADAAFSALSSGLQRDDAVVRRGLLQIEAPAEPVATVEDAPAEPVAAVEGAPAEPVAAVEDAPAEPVATVEDAPAEPVATVEDAPAEPVAAVEDAPFVEDKKSDSQANTKKCKQTREKLNQAKFAAVMKEDWSHKNGSGSGKDEDGVVLSIRMRKGYRDAFNSVVKSRGDSGSSVIRGMLQAYIRAGLPFADGFRPMAMRVLREHAMFNGLPIPYLDLTEGDGWFGSDGVGIVGAAGDDVSLIVPVRIRSEYRAVLNEMAKHVGDVPSSVVRGLMQIYFVSGFGAQEVFGCLAKGCGSVASS